MKRLTFKSSKFSLPIAIVAVSFMGSTAFAQVSPDPEEAETKTQTIVVEETTETTDATAIPNAAPAATITESVPAESLDAGYAETIAAEETGADADVIVIESPETVIISNPDETADAEETETEADPED